MRELRVFFLGRFELHYRQSSEAEWKKLTLPPTAKSRSLLAYLIIHRDIAHSRDKLSELFWGDAPQKKAKRSLSTSLWHIRRCFPEDADPVKSDTKWVQFDFPGALTVDAEQIEMLCKGNSTDSLQLCVNLYKGDFLTGFYDDWAVNLQYRLQSIFMGSLERLMKGHEASGNDAEALEAALRLLELDPLSELAYQTSMRAYLRLGQRERALKMYERLVTNLRQELGAEPSPETKALHQRILDGTWAEDAPQASIELKRNASFPRKGLHLESSPPLVGRTAEMSSLRELWRKAVQGERQIVFLHGESGIGKTRLTLEMGRYVRQRGGVELRGDCSRYEQSEPYGPMVEVLREAVGTSGDALLTSMPEWQISVLARLAPEISRRSPGRGVFGPGAETEQKHLFIALTNLLASIARRAPLLLTIEDLHWAHKSTLAWLDILAHRTSTAPMMLLLTFRDEEMHRGQLLPHFVIELQKEGLASSLTVDRLSREALRTWLKGLDDGLILQIHNHTEGNPFFVLETLRALQDQRKIAAEGTSWRVLTPVEHLPVPDTVRKVVEMRLQQLPIGTRRFLEIAATIGRSFDWDVLVLASGYSEESSLEHLSALLERQIVREAQGAFSHDYEFEHHLVHETVYSSISESRRKKYHESIAKALVELRKGSPGEASEIAFHLSEAGNRDAARPFFLEAGDYAATVAAVDEAVEHYRQALESIQSPGEGLQKAILNRKIGEVYFHKGELPQSEERLKAALRLLDRPFPEGTWSIRIAILKALSKYATSWLFPLGVQKREKGISTSIEEEVDVYTTLGWIYSVQSRYEEYLVVSMRALNVSKRSGLQRGVAMAATALGLAADFIPMFSLAEHFYKMANKASAQVTRPAEKGFVHFGQSYHSYLRGRGAEAFKHARLSSEGYLQAGDVHRWALSMQIQAYVHEHRGDLKSMEAISSEVHRIGTEMEAPRAVCAGEALMGALSRHKGELEEAICHARRAVSLAEQLPDYLALAENLGDLGRCYLMAGDWPSAWSALKKGEEIVSRHDVQGDSLGRFLNSMAEAYLAAAEDFFPRQRSQWLREAKEAVKKALKQGRAFVPGLPEAYRLKGRYEWLSEHPKSAIKWWNRSIELASQLGNAMDVGITSLEMGLRTSDRELYRKGENELLALGALCEIEHVKNSFLKGSTALQ